MTEIADAVNNAESYKPDIEPDAVEPPIQTIFEPGGVRYSTSVPREAREVPQEIRRPGGPFQSQNGAEDTEVPVNREGLEKIKVSVLAAVYRKNSWKVVATRDGIVVDTTTMNPASKTARLAFVKDLPADVKEGIGSLLLHAGLNLQNDMRAWANWMAELAADVANARVAAAEQAATAQRSAAVGRAFQDGEALLSSPDLLYLANEALHEHGLAGEDANASLIYLMMTSRICAKPINCVVKGQSSAGKSYLVSMVLKLFPESAYWELTSMSAKALIYSEREFKHVMVVIFEAAGAADETTSHIIRTLQSEGCIRYLVTEKEDGAMVAREIVKEGPTGFTTTTTLAELHAENETRLWSLTIDESEVQTERVTGATAAPYGIGAVAPTDLGDFQAAQEWLALAGKTHAAIPFAGWLQSKMPDKPVRIRRDFGRLFVAIEASAVLYQCQREKLEDGRVLATVHDYANVYALASAVFGESLRDIPKATLEILKVVDAIYQEKVKKDALAYVTYQELMAKTKLNKRLLKRRLQVAFDNGVLEDRRESKASGATTRLVPHMNLVMTTSLLPEPDELALAYPCLAVGDWISPVGGTKKTFIFSPPCRFSCTSVLSCRFLEQNGPSDKYTVDVLLDFPDGTSPRRGGQNHAALPAAAADPAAVGRETTSQTSMEGRPAADEFPPLPFDAAGASEAERHQYSRPDGDNPSTEGGQVWT
jgi:hypothetical protein